MLGAIIGDVVGSVYEFDNHRSKCFEPFFHSESFYTDDTICTVAVADALVHGRHPAHALKEWGTRYWDNGGWGRSFAMWLGSDSLEPYNSYGNGAGMRVSSAAFLATSLVEALEYSDHVTAVTHNHPEGMKGARATTHAIWLSLHDSPVEEIRSEIAQTYGYNLSRTIDEIRPTYRFNESSQGTVPEAIICALSAQSYEDAIRNAISIGGDSDTLATICGPIAEARFGLPGAMVQHVCNQLPTDIKEVMAATYALALRRQASRDGVSQRWLDSAGSVYGGLQGLS